VETLKCGFVQLYGMTETCGAFTYLPREDHRMGNPRMRSAGKAVPGAEVAIMPVGEERILPTGEEGEVCVRTPAAMKGYWNLPDETARVIQPSGWLRTGDAGYMDADGYVFIRDRVKDMVVSGGENVYPAEVESALYGHPDVAECAVIGVPDDRWGEAVKAVVVRRPGATVTAQALIAYARERIAGYKVPKSIDFVDALPRNASGKVLKNVLRKPHWEGRDRQVN
jgi:fatty-acyl-CoA synthase